MDVNQMRALAEVARTAGTSEASQSAFAQLIVETIEPKRITPDFFSMFMPTRQLNVGDQLVKKVKNRGFPVRTFVPGTEHLADQFVPPREVMTYVIDYIITKVRYNLWEIRRGELPALQDFKNQMEQAMIDNIVSRVWSLLATVWSQANTPDNYATCSGAVSQAILDNMIETVLSKAGRVRSIIGTRKALMPIYKFAGIHEHTISGGSSPTNTAVLPITPILEEWKRTGRISTYLGHTLIEVPQIFENSADNFYKKLVREDIVLVIGDNAGEIITYGDVETQEHTDTSVEPGEYSLAMWRGWGMIVDTPHNIGVIQIV